MSNAGCWLGTVLVALCVLVVGCSDGGDCTPAPTLGVVGAMPSELAPLVARASIVDTQVIDGRVFHIGTLGGVHVVLAMTGIGLVNAAETTRTLLDHFPVDGMVFSGVAGSPHRIADVTVPLAWSEPGGPSIAADPGWLELARRAAAADLAFERCTHVPPDDPSSALVCMPFEPAIFVGGRGESSDGGSPGVACKPGGGDVFGCDPALPAGATTAAARASLPAWVAAAADDGDVTVDMETAAVAGEAATRGLPFIAFRAVSDGAEDPLGLPGFPTQFFAYYRLAADNAAIATEAFLEQLSDTTSAGSAACT
jgi:nucleoside phosphorylase